MDMQGQASHDRFWTIAYRKRSASRFQRVTNWSGTWAEAQEVAHKFGQAHPELQVYYVPDAAYDKAHPSSPDAYNILVESGKRIRVVDNAPALDAEFLPVVVTPFALLGVETVIKAWVASDEPDGSQFDVAVVPSGDQVAVLRYAQQAEANPNWFNVTVEEITPHSPTCDNPWHDGCTNPTTRRGLLHVANAGNGLPAHLRQVNVCERHSNTWSSLWGTWPLSAGDIPLDIDTSDCEAELNASAVEDPEFLDALRDHKAPKTRRSRKPRVGDLVRFDGKLCLVRHVGSRWLKLLDMGPFATKLPKRVDRSLCSLA